MSEPTCWRDVLKHIVSTPAERERLAQALGVLPVTLTHWINGDAVPRSQHVHLLLKVVPQEHQERLLQLLEQDPLITIDPAAQALNKVANQIPYQLIMQVHETRALMPQHLHFWTISHLVLEEALRQLDPQRLGMAIRVVQCLLPSRKGKIRSLRKSVRLGSGPWEGDLKEQALFLGAGSLAGYAIETGHSQGQQDLLIARPGCPASRSEHGVDALALPIQFASRTAGALLFSSSQPNYFLSQPLLPLVHGYTQLLALAFLPEEFYPQECFQLHPMPPSHVQQAHFVTFRRRVYQLMKDSVAVGHPLTSQQAEQIIWQQFEEEFIQLACDLPQDKLNS